MTDTLLRVFHMLTHFMFIITLWSCIILFLKWENWCRKKLNNLLNVSLSRENGSGSRICVLIHEQIRGDPKNITYIDPNQKLQWLLSGLFIFIYINSSVLDLEFHMKILHFYKCPGSVVLKMCFEMNKENENIWILFFISST